MTFRQYNPKPVSEIICDGCGLKSELIDISERAHKWITSISWPNYGRLDFCGEACFLNWFNKIRGKKKLDAPI